MKSDRMLGQDAPPHKGLSGPPVGDPGLARLVEGIRRGDEKSLAAFYDATSRWVYGLALKIVGEAAAAEEVVLDVFLQVWRRAASYQRERGSPESWLLAIARSRAVDRLRSGAAIRRREEPLEAPFDRASGGPDPRRVTAEEERRERVARALASLPSEQKRAIELAFFQGLTHREVAAALAEPLGTVKTRIRLGMMKLRETLRPFEDLHG